MISEVNIFFFVIGNEFCVLKRIFDFLYDDKLLIKYLMYLVNFILFGFKIFFRRYCCFLNLFKNGGFVFVMLDLLMIIMYLKLLFILYVGLLKGLSVI